MRRKKIMLIQYPAISHLNASFKLVEALERNNFEVIYFIGEKVKDYITTNGLKWYISYTNPVVEEFDEEAMKKDKIKYPYVDRLKDNMMRLFFDSRKKELTKAIYEISPDIIIADTFSGSDFGLIYTLLKQRNIKYFYLETMLSSIESRGIPYIDAKSMPNEKGRMQLEHLYRSSKRLINRFLRNISYFGYDNYNLLKKETKKQLIPSIYKIDNKNYMDICFTNICSLLTSPIEIEFFSKPQHDKQYYLGFFVNNTNPIISDPALKEIIESNKKIIYISFGTVFGDKKSNDILKFMICLNKTLDEFKNDVIAIFSLGKARWGEDDIAQLTNIHVFSFVPQFALLKYCSLFITHGGLNSVKESIEQTVPMLIYPLDIDQIGNSRKVEYKKLGLYGDLKKESVQGLKSKIKATVFDNQYKENLVTFRNLIEKKYDFEKILLQVIEKEGSII